MAAGYYANALATSAFVAAAVGSGWVGIDNKSKMLHGYSLWVRVKMSQIDNQEQ